MQDGRVQPVKCKCWHRRLDVAVVGHSGFQQYTQVPGPTAVKPAPPNLAPSNDQPARLTFAVWAGSLGSAHLCSAWSHFRMVGRTGEAFFPRAFPGYLAF